MVGSWKTVRAVPSPQVMFVPVENLVYRVIIQEIRMGPGRRLLPGLISAVGLSIPARSVITQTSRFCSFRTRRNLPYELMFINDIASGRSQAGQIAPCATLIPLALRYLDSEVQAVALDVGEVHFRCTRINHIAVDCIK